MSEEIHKVKPKYEFANIEGQADITPYKRTIAKTMEVTEHFDLYSAIEYVEKMRKARDSKLAEVEGLDKMIKAYEEEIASIENELGLKKLEEEFNAPKEVSEEVKEDAKTEENA